MNDELPDRLRVAAQEYEPDRERMWTRVSDGMREPRVRDEPVRTGWRIPQLALATGAAVVLVGAVVFFGYAMGIGPASDPVAPPAAGPGTRTVEAPDPETSEGDSGGLSDSPPDDAEETPDAEATSDDAEVPEGVDWMWTDGSIDPGSNEYWTQSNLTLKNEEPLVALVVELRVAEGDGVEPMDSWSTDIDRFGDAVVTREDGYLVYRWTLREGTVLPAGEYTLAGQFSHEAARSAYPDDYSFEAEAESGDRGRNEGDFA